MADPETESAYPDNGTKIGPGVWGVQTEGKIPGREWIMKVEKKMKNLLK